MNLFQWVMVLDLRFIGHNTHNTKHTPVQLKNILYVPNIKRDLLSISQLTADNNFVVEFHSNCCFAKAKDKVTGRWCFKGILKMASTNFI